MLVSFQSGPYIFLSSISYISVVPSHIETEMVCVKNRICRSNGMWPPRLDQWRDFSFCPGLLDASLQETSHHCEDCRQVTIVKTVDKSVEGPRWRGNWGGFINASLSALCMSHLLGRVSHPSQTPGPEKLWTRLSGCCYFKWLNFRIICSFAVDSTICKHF